MRRRDFITTMAVGTATWPLSIRADQPAQVPLIGVLFADKAESPFSKLFLSAFPKLLQDERGSAPGAKTEIKYRFSGGDTDPNAGQRERADWDATGCHCSNFEYSNGRAAS